MVDENDHDVTVAAIGCFVVDRANATCGAATITTTTTSEPGARISNWHCEAVPVIAPDRGALKRDPVQCIGSSQAALAVCVSVCVCLCCTSPSQTVGHQEVRRSGKRASHNGHDHKLALGEQCLRVRDCVPEVKELACTASAA